MNNATSNCQWGMYHAGQNGTGGLPNGSLGFYNFNLSSHILQLRPDGNVHVVKSLYVGTDIFVAGNSLITSLGNKQPLHANLTTLSSATPTLPTLITTGDVTINGSYLKIPNTGFSQINLGNMYINCSPAHERGDLHLYDTITNHRFIGWYSNSLTLSLRPIGGAGKLYSDALIDVGFNSVAPSIIQSNNTGSVLKVKNRHASGYSEVRFFNNNETSNAAIGIGNTSTAAPHKDTLYLQCANGLYLDSPDGGKITRPVVSNIWDNASTGQNATIANAFSKVFTTTRTLQVYNGSLAIYCNQLSANITFSCRIDDYHLIFLPPDLHWGIIRSHLLGLEQLEDFNTSVSIATQSDITLRYIQPAIREELTSQFPIFPRMQNTGNGNNLFKQVPITRSARCIDIQIFPYQTDTYFCHLFFC
ncbi:hypothetical protein DFS34DRAFT_633260 [Phlyctochytrium arcticum]|nr:hypothetical protein DFS34DRAFT_633260 [Phlyctochytrium arcticum]